MTEYKKKKLIEVAIPLKAINEACVREKYIRRGHPSTLHLWWARRPLAACRAILFAQIVDDPSSHFDDEEKIDEERKRLFRIIEDLVVWENSANEEVLKRARDEIHKNCGGQDLPPIFDPFSGGCSIPLEALRLGLPAFGSDLNPVAVMIGKAMIEIPPRFKGIVPAHPVHEKRIHYGNYEGLAEDIKYYGDWIREQANERIGHLYPSVNLSNEYSSSEATVIAWIWTRTVPSPDPAFGKMPVPIASSFLLKAKPTGKEVWIEPFVDRYKKKITYQIRRGGTAEEISVAKAGTKSGKASFVCLFSKSAITSEYVKSMGMNGKIGSTLIAVVAEGNGQRLYLEPTKEIEAVALSAKPQWKPDQPMNRNTTNLVSGRGYGFFDWADLYSKRQLVALTTLSDLVHEVRDKIKEDALSAEFANDSIPLRDGGSGARAYAEAVSVYLSFAIDRVAMCGNCFVRWRSDNENAENVFGRQAIPMVWDYAETNPLGNATGSFQRACAMVQNGLQNLHGQAGVVSLVDAQSISITQGAILNTDPPYYDNIGYAELSDFFYCWMKPLISPIYPDLFATIETPKSQELVASSYRHGSQKAAESFFLDEMLKSISQMSKQLSPNYPAAIYYAYKQSEISLEGVSSTGWATFLQAVIEAGYAVVGTWPIRSEMKSRLIAIGTNALANSVVLVCRKRDENAETISRSDLISFLKRELPSAIASLQKTSISPADMPQSAIGPGMAIFSRYKSVLEADDSPMSVKSALQLINRELDDYLGHVKGDFDAITRFTLKWFEQFGKSAADYGTANNIATAYGISVKSVENNGIVESVAGKVRIIERDELDTDWNPATDSNLTVWKCCQHLIRELEQNGEQAAASLFLRMGHALANSAKDLAYCLFDVCAKTRKDSTEAISYNNLISVWPELSLLSESIVVEQKIEQQTIDL